MKGVWVTRQEREQFLKILQAHAQTVAIGEACATTTQPASTVDLERFVGIGTRRLERRDDADQDAGGDRQSQAPQQHPCVNGSRQILPL